MTTNFDIKNDQLISKLSDILGKESVITEESEREFYSIDVYSKDKICAAVVRPRNKELLKKAIPYVTKSGYSIIVRGGGMSYTKGYVPTKEDTIIFDVSLLNQVIEINETDMYITVEAGVTWKDIYDKLKPTGLRLPFFGTFSGIRATVGGGLSQGALFMGTARYGQAADIVLSMEVLLPDGTIVKTGQSAFKNSKPFYRTYGPDLNGLFIHDGGSLGIKTEATFRLISAPKETDYLTFLFPDVSSACLSLSQVAKSGAAEEAYVFDPVSTRKNLSTLNIKEELKTIASVAKNQSSIKKGIFDATKLVLSGRDFVKEDMYSLHIVCAGRSFSSVSDDIKLIRKICGKNKAEEIPNSIPKAVRSNPFKPLNGVIGSDGDRWVALNAKVPHSHSNKIINEADKILEKYKVEMNELGVTVSRLFIAIGTHAFSYEPVFHWHDSWLPIHRKIPEENYINKIKEPKANTKATELVEQLRMEMVQLFADLGASSNQIGKTYLYSEMLNPNTLGLLKSIKKYVDPDSQLNPGVIGLN